MVTLVLTLFCLTTFTHCKFPPVSEVPSYSIEPVGLGLTFPISVMVSACACSPHPGPPSRSSQLSELSPQNTIHCLMFSFPSQMIFSFTEHWRVSMCKSELFFFNMKLLPRPEPWPQRTVLNEILLPTLSEIIQPEANTWIG